MDLEYIDIDEMREHPFAEKTLKSLEDIMKLMRAERSFTEYRDFKENYPEGFDHEKFEEFQNTEQGGSVRECMEFVRMLNSVKSMVESLTETCNIQISGHIDGAASVDLNIGGKGFRELLLFILKLAIVPMMESCIEDAVNAFKDSN